MITQNTLKVVKTIQQQTESIPTNMIYVLDFASTPKFTSFQISISVQLQKYQQLQMLTFNDCNITSLQNFPTLPFLIRLDLVMNSIKGNQLIHLVNLSRLQTLMMGGNLVETIEQIEVLKVLDKILKLDFINNPVQKIAGYRNRLFDSFTSLMILDTLDKSGKDGYNNATMVQTVSRVPDNLFDKTPIIPVVRPIPVVPVPVISIPKLLKKVSNEKKVINQKNRIKKLTNNNLTSQIKSNNRSKRAGLQFPVTRIKRHLHSKLSNKSRVSVTASIYLAAVLQYLTAQLLNQSGNVALNDKKKRITPRMIKKVIQTQGEQLGRLLRDVTIPMQQ